MIRFLLVAAPLALSLASAPAQAQRGRDEATPAQAADEAPAAEELSEAERVALARDQFQQGIRFARQNRWQQAADRFGRALELKDTPQIRYNLAESLSHLGRLVEAAEQLSQLESAEDAPPAVAENAAALRASVDERLGRLRIDVQGLRPGVRVVLDGRDLPTAVIGVEQPVDPGRHLVRMIVGDDEVVQTEEVLVPEGGAEAVTLVAPALPPVTTAPDAGSDATVDDDEEGGSLWWLWTTLAVALVAGGAVATYFILTAEPSPTEGNFMPPYLEIR